MKRCGGSGLRVGSSTSASPWEWEEATEPLKIFSYGSNMSTRRLAARVPSARFVATGHVVGYTLRFHNKGRLDSSGKANMLHTGSEEDRVWGVLWKIDPAQKPDLDRAEGVGAGYEEERVEVRVPGVPGVSARAYVADPAYIDDRLLPYEWYLDFVVAGAREHGLPKAYVTAIEARESARDPDEERRQRNRRILGGPPE